jgi:hypothetical protein
MGIKYASRNVSPSFNLLCSADKKTIEQQQQDPANIIKINAEENKVRLVRNIRFQKNMVARK